MCVIFDVVCLCVSESEQASRCSSTRDRVRVDSRIVHSLALLAFPTPTIHPTKDQQSQTTTHNATATPPPAAPASTTARAAEKPQIQTSAGRSNESLPHDTSTARINHGHRIDRG